MCTQRLFHIATHDRVAVCPPAAPSCCRNCYEDPNHPQPLQDASDYPCRNTQNEVISSKKTWRSCPRGWTYNLSKRSVELNEPFVTITHRPPHSRFFGRRVRLHHRLWCQQPVPPARPYEMPPTGEETSQPMRNPPI